MIIAVQKAKVTARIEASDRLRGENKRFIQSNPSGGSLFASDACAKQNGFVARAFLDTAIVVVITVDDSKFSRFSVDDPAVFDFDNVIVGPDESAVVGDDHEGTAAIDLVIAQQGEDLIAPLVIEVAGRLVGQQDRPGP